MHFLAKSPGHSFDFHAMNMSHIVHHYYFGALRGPELTHRLPCCALVVPAVITLCAVPLHAGNKPSPRRRAALAKLHPGGLTDDWADKLVGQAFTSANQKVTHEHYSQVPHLYLGLHRCPAPQMP